MHLLVCLKMFHASPIVRALVLAAQTIMTPALMLVYAIHPRSMHRFVGYLEETATDTYISIIQNIETEGSHLNLAWKDTPAPEIAISKTHPFNYTFVCFYQTRPNCLCGWLGYWRLPTDAKWVDTLRCICADETHHRDVNHTYASLKVDFFDCFCLFIHIHKSFYLKGWRAEPFC